MGSDRRLYGVVQRGFELHLQPSESPRWRDRPAGTAVLLEVAAGDAREPVGTLLVERDRPDVPAGALRRAGLACTTRCYRGVGALEGALRDAAAAVMAEAVEGADLARFESLVRERFRHRDGRPWALDASPSLDSVALVEHPVSAEFVRAGDGASLWVIARARRDARAHEAPFVRTRLVDLDYSTGAGAPTDDDMLALVDAAAERIRAATRGEATLSRGVEASQEALLAAGDLRAGWSLVAVRRVAPNRWADGGVDDDLGDVTDEGVVDEADRDVEPVTAH